MAIEWVGRGCESKQKEWITMEDDKMKIEDMTTPHIIKAIAYIWKYGGKLRDFETDKVDEFEFELKRRQDDKKC